jgi:hypothetical protein
MMVYEENVFNKIKIRFDYEFTQNQGLADEKVHKKSLEETINLKSMSPFQLEWNFKSESCFLKSLKKFIIGQIPTEGAFIKDSEVA